MPISKTLPAIIAALILTMPATAKQLEGYIKQNESIQLDASAEHPEWISPTATTNEDMVGIYGSPMPWHKSKPIPSFGAIMRLSKSITQHWPGGYSRLCLVRCTPIKGHPGNFYFSTIADSKGPRGWLQDLGSGEKRGWLYRYWLDTKESEKEPQPNSVQTPSTKRI
jgi:hypothetical protein